MEEILEMASSGTSSKGNRKLTSKQKMSLEDYIDFVNSNKSLKFTVNFMNQIINMHGFKRMHNVPKVKNVLIEAIKTLDLIDPSRSTLKEETFSYSSMSLEDARVDLEELNWQECCVTSIENISAWQGKEKGSKTKSFEKMTAHRGLDDSSQPKMKMRKINKVVVGGDAVRGDAENYSSLSRAESAA